MLLSRFKKVLFGSQYEHSGVQEPVYEPFVLSLLLQGVECWYLIERLFQNLHSLHNRCVPVMCYVNKMETCLFRKATSKLLQGLSLSPIYVYVSKRQLHWVVHAISMPQDCLSRKIISSWVCSKRPKSSPNLTYGRSPNKSLKKTDVDNKNCQVLSLDCDG